MRDPSPSERRAHRPRHTDHHAVHSQILRPERAPRAAPVAVGSEEGSIMAKGSVYEGKSFDEAVKKGLDELGLNRAEATITLIEEGKSGFLGFGSRPFRVSIMRRPGGAVFPCRTRCRFLPGRPDRVAFAIGDQAGLGPPQDLLVCRGRPVPACTLHSWHKFGALTRGRPRDPAPDRFGHPCRRRPLCGARVPGVMRELRTTA